MDEVIIVQQVMDELKGTDWIRFSANRKELQETLQEDEDIPHGKIGGVYVVMKEGAK